MATFRQGLLSGLKHSAVGKYSNVAVNLGIGLVLARLLTPEDYGVVAIVSVFILFFGMLSTLGLSSGVVQFDDLSRRQLASLLNSSMIIGIILAFFFVLFSYWIAVFYDNDVYISIGQVMSVSVFFKAASAIPQGLLQRDRKFKLLGMLAVIANVSTGVLGIVLAFQGHSYWALVYRTVFSSALLFFLTFYYSKAPTALVLDPRGLRPFVRYSGFTFLFDFVNYFGRNLDTILVGKYLGTQPLGIYDKAYTLMKMPLDNLLNLVSPVLHPLLVQYKSDTKKLFNIHSQFLRILCILGIFISVFCYSSSVEIITMLYGDRWIESAVAFKWLSLSIWIQMVLSSSGPFFLISGKTKYYFLTGLLSTISIVVAVILGISYGSVERLSVFITIAFIFNLFQCYFILYRCIFGYSIAAFIKAIYKPIIAGGIGFLMLIPLSQADLNIFFSLSLKLFVLVLGFMLGLLITGEMGQIRVSIHQVMGKKILE